jgi:hypothetical protein
MFLKFNRCVTGTPCVQIYNEQITDLLEPSSKNLQVSSRYLCLADGFNNAHWTIDL